MMSRHMELLPMRSIIARSLAEISSRQPSMAAIVRADGSWFRPRPDDGQLPGEVFIGPGESQYWDSHAVLRAMDRNGRWATLERDA